MRNSSFMDDDYGDDYPEGPPSALEDEKTKKHTKQHYVWLVEKLLAGLGEQKAFENNHPTLATSSDLSTIRKEMETALSDSMRMVYCHEQVELLETILEEGESALEVYLTDLAYMLGKEISECTFNGTLQECQTNHDADEWERLIEASGLITTLPEPNPHHADWLKRNIPPKSPEFLNTIRTIFPKESKLQKATCRVDEHIQRTILCRKILIQSLDLGSAAFGVESSMDKMVKSYMRSGDLGPHQQKEA